MIEPQRCPACGSKPEQWDTPGVSWVMCRRPMCVLYGPSRKTLKAAIAAWNRLRYEPAKRKETVK